MPILVILCYNGSLVTGTVVSLTAAKFKPLIFSMPGFTLSYAGNILILMIFHDFWLLPAQFAIKTYTHGRLKTGLQIADRCSLWKVSNGAKNPVLQKLQFKDMCVCRSKPRGQTYVITNLRSFLWRATITLDLKRSLLTME
jgi:hypothetical protein